MKVFLTGGMGFIGSYITMELLQHGYEVTILARNPNKIKAFQNMPRLHIIQGGLEDHAVITTNLPGHDVCIHNALFWGNGATELLLNDTANAVFLFESAARLGVNHFIYTSSTAALGEYRPRTDEDSKCTAIDYYGAAKEASEAFLLAVAAQTSMRCNIIRPSYTVGNPVVPGAPMENDEQFRRIVRLALAGSDIPLIQYDGTQFIGAADLAKVYRAVLESNGNREIYLATCSQFTTWEQIAQEAVQLAHSESKILLEDRQYGPDFYVYDPAKIERNFGFSFKSRAPITAHLKYLIEHRSLLTP